MDMDRKYQRDRKTPHKPAVVKDHYMWWAQVQDANDELVHECFFNQQDALAYAYKLAAEMERQRLIAALAASPSKAVGP